MEKRMGRLRVPSLRRARASELGRRGVLAGPVVVPMIGHAETLAFRAWGRQRPIASGGRTVASSAAAYRGRHGHLHCVHAPRDRRRPRCRLAHRRRPFGS